MNALTPDVGYQPANEKELLDICGPAAEATPAPHDPDPLRMHDAGNAKRLVERFGHSIRYVRKWDSWICFQEGRWMKDESGEIQRMAKRNGNRHSRRESKQHGLKTRNAFPTTHASLSHGPVSTRWS